MTGRRRGWDGVWSSSKSQKACPQGGAYELGGGMGARTARIRWLALLCFLTCDSYAALGTSGLGLPGCLFQHLRPDRAQGRGGSIDDKSLGSMGSCTLASQPGWGVIARLTARLILSPPAPPP
jgi:hypothetical protein